MAKRRFRNEDSLVTEARTRALVPDYLKAKGYRIEGKLPPVRPTRPQIIPARTSDGERLRIWVKLCWRPRTRDGGSIAACQILARAGSLGHVAALKKRLAARTDEGITHMLVVKRVGREFPYAALVPLYAVLPIWRAQRDASQALIDSGALGARHKNHAENGDSPTIYLADESAPSVAAALWRYTGVRDLSSKNSDAISLMRSGAVDDTLDDLPTVDIELVGADEREPVLRLRSYVPRDPKVRQEVLRRASGICERPTCGEARPYRGFLDVHHVFGVAKSDKVTTCVAICPNCHREAHRSPQAEAINKELKRIAAAHR